VNNENLKSTENVSAVVKSTVAKKPSTVKELLTLPAIKSQIALALPKHITPDRMIRMALTLINQTPRLQECTKESVMSCLFQSAQLGLEPGPLGQVYYIPFYDKRKGAFVAQFVPGYKGLIDLARRGGKVNSLYAACVFENEEFEILLGLERNLKHTPLSPDKRGKNYKGFYAVVRYIDNSFDFEFMWPEEVESIRARSRSKDDGPWVTDYEEMAKKTVLKRLLKRQSMSSEFHETVANDEMRDYGKDAQAELPAEVQQLITEEDAQAEKGWTVHEVRQLMEANTELAELVKKAGLTPTAAKEYFKKHDGDVQKIKEELKGLIG